MFFRLMELECTLISHGSEAVPTLSRLRPDVLILDLDLPDLRALDIAREVQAVLPRLGIIFLTAREGIGEVRFGVPVLRKPRGKFEDLLAIFEVVLGMEEE